jgi:drug/metabolite transporter (DMT)-like permease
LTPTTSDYFKLHFIVLLWGFTAILGKLVSIPAVEMVFYRILLAAVGMGMIMIFLRTSFKISSTDFWKIFFTGFIVAAHWLTFFISGRVANASVSLVGFATGSLWTALIEPLVKRKKIQAIEVALGLMVIAGLYIIFAFDFQYPLGLFLGIISGLTMALFAVINSTFVSRVHPYTITFYEMTGACIGTALFFPVYTYYFSSDHQLHLIPSLPDWIYIAAMAWACSVYAYTAALDLMKKVSVFLISLTLNLEPVYGIIMAVIVFGESEKMTLNFYIGTLVILGAVLSYPLLKNRWMASKQT